VYQEGFDWNDLSATRLKSATRESDRMTNSIGEPLYSATLTVCLVALVSLPLWFVTVPPLYDYPFHLARLQILHDIAAGGPLARYYELSSFLVPSAAIDVIGWVLQQFLSVEDAGRAFLFAIMLLAISGAAFLAKTLSGRSGAAPWLAAGLTYNFIFGAGFVNYLFGVALLPWAIGIHLRMRHASAVTRLSIGMISCLALFFAHVAAFVLYTLTIVAFEMPSGVRSLRHNPRASAQRWLVLALPPLATAVLFLTLSPTTKALPEQVTWPHLGSALRFVRYKTLWPVDALGSGNEPIDVVSAITAVAIGLGIGCVGRVRITRESLIALVMLTAVFWAAPYRLLATEYVDLRLPIAIFLLAAGFIEITIPDRRATAAVIAAAVALLTFRSVAIAANWRDVERIERELVEAYRSLAPGSILFVADTEPGLDLTRWPQIGHFNSLAEIVAGAFVPATWADPTRQLVQVKAEYADIYEFQTPSARKVEHVAALAHFRREIEDLMSRRKESGQESFGGHTYLLLFFPRPLAHPQLENAKIVADHEYFTLYRLDVSADARQRGTDATSVAVRPSIH